MATDPARRLIKTKVEKITYQPIGIIHSPFKTLKNMPIQPSAAAGIRGSVELMPQLSDGLDDLDGFSHIYLIYHLHLSKGYKLKVVPFLDDQLRGVFSTRAPKRPNAIGLSVVKLIEKSSNVLIVQDIDILDGTPLLDIKPFVPQMYNIANCKTGWLEKTSDKLKNKRSDNRFCSRPTDSQTGRNGVNN